MIVEKGYAKINLVLEVVGKRSDGYHDLEMISTTIDLYDELYFTPISENRIYIECDQFSSIPKESNLIYKMAIYLKERFNIKSGVKVKVVKRIPMGAGLAGGSADAAATLRALNKMWHLNLSLEELAEIGLEYGSDIPFCVYNKAAIVRGRGEKLEFIDDVPFGYVVMVHPDFSSSTKSIFTNFNGTLAPKGYVEKMHQAIKYSDLTMVAKCLYNDLEATVDQVYTNNRNRRPIENIKKQLVKYGALNSVMSGSGSTVYGLCLNSKQATRVKNKYLVENKQQFSSLKYASNSYNISVYSIHSSRKSVKANVEVVEEKRTLQEKEQTKPIFVEERKPEYTVKEIIQTKAYGRAMISFSSNNNHYQIIEAPVNVYDDLVIEIIDKPIYKVFVNDKETSSFVLAELLQIIKKFSLPDGYIIKINQHIHPSLRLVKSQTYIARIIRKLSKVYNIDINYMFDNLHSRLKCFQFESLYEYSNRTNEVKFLPNIPFSYIVVIPIHSKKNVGYGGRRNVTDNFDEYQNVLKGLELSDYFLVAANITNNLDNYYLAEYQKTARANKVEVILEQIRKSKSNNYIFSNDGTSITVFYKTEKRANNLLQRLKKVNIIGVKKFSFKSTVSHQSSVLSFEDKINLGQLHTTKKDPIVANENLEDELSEDNFVEVIGDKEVDLSKKYIYEEDLEGLFHIASPGSLFKQYDYVDLAYFFYRYFHNTKFDLTIDGKPIRIVFNINWLPHIFGLHLIDKDDKDYRGYSGVNKLLSGEISYDGLKKLRNKRKISDEILDEIIQKTQSAFMVLKDLYTNNLNKIQCFDKEIIKKPGSKMKNLEYAIARRMAVNYQRNLNLVGIGYNETYNNYYFYTSFLWKVDKTITKDDYLSITVQKKL